MTKKERVFAALKKQSTDRVPFSVYQHSSVHDRSVEKFVDYTLAYQKKYDPDYVKVMFDDHYDLPPVYDFVRTKEVWSELEEYDIHLGAFGRQLEALKRIKNAVGEDVPVTQTVYLPFHFGMRLAYRRILEDLKTDEGKVIRGLSVIANNLISFCSACLSEAGIDGFFYAAYGCEKSWLSEELYRRLVMPLDLTVIKALVSAPISILHIHGERDAYFSLLKDYPVSALSWEDRTAGPSLVEALSLTGKCLVGGIDHVRARRCLPQDVIAEGKEAIAVTNGRGLILAPGCTFLAGTPEDNMLALKQAVKA
jgi:uroporphyrinogen decarboxylase